MQNIFVTLQFLYIFVPLKLTTMKLAILPNWCKWLTLVLIVAAFSIDFNDYKDAFLRGYHSIDENYNRLPKTPDTTTQPRPYADLIIFLSIIIYILSKDKRDDDFINLIRAKALLIALLLSTLTIMMVYLFNKEIDSLSFLLIHFLLYISIFKIMKIRADFTTIDE